MARVGRFGRRRIGGTNNLTMLIANLMREQRQAEDRAAFDAWENGGEFKGKPMTDERLLQYIKDRRDGFTTDDPLWDEWNNRLVQTKFSIGEQKITTAFKQGKASAGAVAAWYRGQLKNIPKNSAFYREIAGRAGEWAKSAAGSARAAGAARAAAHIENKLNKLNDRVNANNGLIDAVVKAATRAGVMKPGQTLTGGDNSSAVDASELMEWLQSGAVTYRGQVVSFKDIQEAAVDTYRALGGVVQLYKQRNWDTDGVRRNRAMALAGAVALNATDDRSKYEAARENWQDDLAAAGNDPYAIAAANENYAKALGGIYSAAAATKGTDENSADFLSALQGEIKALNGDGSGTTPASLYDQADGNDAASTAESALRNVVNLEALRNGTAYYGQAEPGGQYAVINDPDGARAYVAGSQPTVIRINGMARTVYLRGREIASTVLRAPDGTVIGLSSLTAPVSDYLRIGYTATTGAIVGYEYQSPEGKKSWGVTQPDGSLKFTQENPFTSVIPMGDGSLAAVGEAPDEASGEPIGGYLNPYVNPAGLSPLPLPMNVTPEEVRAAMGNTNDPGNAYKAQEYADYLRETRDPNYTGRPAATPSPLIGGQMSDAQMERAAASGAPVIASYLSASLYGIQSGLAPLFGTSSTGSQTPAFQATSYTKPPTTLTATPPTPPSSYMAPKPPPPPPPAPKPFVTPPTASSNYKPRKKKEQQTYKQPSGWIAS